MDARVAGCGVQRAECLVHRARRLGHRDRCPWHRAGCVPLVLTFVLGLAAGARAEVLDRVLAVVGGEVITLTDVTAARDFGLVVVPPSAADPVGAALTQLIDRALILAEVERYVPPEPSIDDVNASLAIVRRRFSSDADFQAALARSGIDENHLRETLRQNLRIRAYLNQRFVAGPSDAPAPAAGRDRQQTMIDEWVAGLRRRAAIVDLYVTGR